MSYIHDDKMTDLQKAAVAKLRKDFKEIEDEILSYEPKMILMSAYGYVNAGDYLGAFERNLDTFTDEQLKAIAEGTGNILNCRDIRDSEMEDNEMLCVWNEAIYNRYDIEGDDCY